VTNTLPPELHRARFLPDLLVAALNRHPDRPAVYLGDQVLTGREVADQVSCYAQAYAAQGIGRGSAVSMLSPNRPEVLFTLGANMVTGCRATPLHPLGSVDDHAYVVDDAEIETLVFDPAFAERAQELQQRCPGLKRLLSLGPCDAGDDLLALAAKFTPEPLQAPDVNAEDIAGLAYTGGTTGKPKGVMGTYRSAPR
jgi:fatty-acyl-CoA synthase